jgi:hypothetical protein
VERHALYQVEQRAGPCAWCRCVLCGFTTPGLRLCTPMLVTPLSASSAARLSHSCVSARFVDLWVAADLVNYAWGRTNGARGAMLSRTW